MKLLVTGSNGFVGSALVLALEHKGYDVVRAVRKSPANGEISIGDIDAHTNWSQALSGVDVVVHLAARVHDLKQSGDQLDAYRTTNVEGAIALAKAAQQAGVKRFIFLSSVKVMGEGKNTPYSESDFPSPEDAYGVSKWEAERALLEMTKTANMDIVILRPPLVYGPNVGANFLRLLKLAASGIPLPLGAIKNQRSLIYIGNLVDVIGLCLTHPAAAGKTYFISDGDPISVPKLLRLLAEYMDRSARLVSLPVYFLQWAGLLSGRQKDIQRLVGSLIVDDRNIRKQLGWTPPFTTEMGLKETVGWYRYKYKN